MEEVRTGGTGPLRVTARNERGGRGRAGVSTRQRDVMSEKEQMKD